MDNKQLVLRKPFDIKTHKQNFINYLEVIITEDGTIMYAVPSHQEKLIKLVYEKLNITREELNALCPEAYYFNFMDWLCQVSGCVSLWNERMVGKSNEIQKNVIEKLQQEGVYQGKIF